MMIGVSNPRLHFVTSMQGRKKRGEKKSCTEKLRSVMEEYKMSCACDPWQKQREEMITKEKEEKE